MDELLTGEALKGALCTGTAVQLTDKAKNQMFAFCMMTVTDIKEWGALGYVQALGEKGQVGGVAYYRATWDEMVYVGEAAYMVG